MKNILKYILPTAITALLVSGCIYGATVLFPYQGGTGQDTSGWTGFPYVTSGTWGTTTAVTSESDPIWTAASTTYLLLTGGTISGALTVSGTSTLATTTITGDFTVNTDDLFIDAATGNVGIGTTSLTSRLHIGTTQWNVGDDTPLVNITNLDSNDGDCNALLVRGGARSAGAQTFEVKDYDGNTDFVVTGDGGVGIGFDSPTEFLHIQGTGADDATIRVDGGATEGDAILRLDADDSGHNADIKRIMSEASTGNLVFDYFNGAFQTGFVMDSDGKVGIGTTTPSVMLSVGATSTQQFFFFLFGFFF